MSLIDLVGVLGVLLVLLAYAGAQLGRLDPRDATSLTMNLAGAGLILGSLLFRFNLAAFLMESAWASVAAFGLVRLALRRPDRPASDPSDDQAAEGAAKGRKACTTAS